MIDLAHAPCSLCHDLGWFVPIATKADVGARMWWPCYACPAIGKWIPMAQVHPPDGQLCTVRLVGEGPFPEIRALYVTRDCADRRFITHWVPLPPLPEATP